MYTVFRVPGGFLGKPPRSVDLRVDQSKRFFVQWRSNSPPLAFVEFELGIRFYVLYLNWLIWFRDDSGGLLLLLFYLLVIFYIYSGSMAGLRTNLRAQHDKVLVELGIGVIYILHVDVNSMYVCLEIPNTYLRAFCQETTSMSWEWM